jgi:hypothetical protein
MRRVTIAVIGNAKTTRANVEALIGDVIDSVDEAIIATVYKDKQSEPQLWAEQYARDKEIPVLQYSQNNYDELFAENLPDEVKFFISWDDQDEDSQLAWSISGSRGVPMFDLTNGLIRIGNVVPPTMAPPSPKPVESVVEKIEEPAVVEVPSEPAVSLSDAIAEIIEVATREFASKVTADILRLIEK